MAKLNKTTLICIGVAAAAATPLVFAAPVLNNLEVQKMSPENIEYKPIPELRGLKEEKLELVREMPESKIYYRSLENSDETYGRNINHTRSDHPNPQQTYGSAPIIGLPISNMGYGGYGKESITAIAANSAGAGASAKIGLVSLAGIIGAAALF